MRQRHSWLADGTAAPYPTTLLLFPRHHRSSSDRSSHTAPTAVSAAVSTAATMSASATSGPWDIDSTRAIPGLAGSPLGRTGRKAVGSTMVAAGGQAGQNGTTDHPKLKASCTASGTKTRIFGSSLAFRCNSRVTPSRSTGSSTTPKRPGKCWWMRATRMASR